MVVAAVRGDCLNLQRPETAMTPSTTVVSGGRLSNVFSRGTDRLEAVHSNQKQLEMGTDEQG